MEHAFLDLEKLCEDGIDVEKCIPPLQWLCQDGRNTFLLQERLCDDARPPGNMF